MEKLKTKFALALVALFFAQTALAQGPSGGGPGPQPVPSPWVVNGASISYGGCVLVPVGVAGGCKGNGTINATAIYQGGFQVLGTLANGKIFVGNSSAVAVAQTPSGDLTMTNAGVFTVSANAITNAKLAQAAAVTLKGNPTNATANVQDFTLAGLSALASPSTTLDLLLVWDHTAGTFKSVTPAALTTAVGGITALTGDVTATGPGSVAATLATVNANVGTFGSATQSVQLTVNGKGLVTAAANVTVTPAVGSITGLGTGVATALGVNVGSAGAFVTFNGAGGTPSSMVGTNITGTAAGLTAGNVTTNANLTGVITSIGNATSITSQTGTGTKFVVDTGPTIAGLTVTGSLAATGLVTNADLATMATNTVKGNATSGSASPTDLAVGSCDTATKALQWTTNTGFGCNSSITAAAVPASGLTGTTLSASVVTSSLTTVGALGGGSATTGFTINAANVTVSGQFAGAAVATAANASGSPSATFGVVKCDGTTITCASGVITSIGGVATSVQVGVTTITSGADKGILYSNAGTLAQYTVSGTGTVVCMTVSCSMTTPTLGVATATSINKMAITAPATGSTLAVADGKTATISNTMTLTATDSSSIAFGAGGTVTYTVASGAKALATGAIGSGTCSSAQTDTATGAATTDAVAATFNADPTAVTGYVPATSGMLTIIAYPTANTVNFKVCNNTGSSITPGAVTINWRVTR